MEPILAETFGTMIYQDQVMQIASAVAGYSLGEADVLRAAMGKKDKVKMARQREKFPAEMFDLHVACGAAARNGGRAAKKADEVPASGTAPPAAKAYAKVPLAIWSFPG